MSTDYVPTKAFSDEQGQAILATLWDLYGNLEVNLETKKKVRQGSREKYHAIAALQAELIKVGAHFEHAREFDDWLYNNMAGVVDAYNPIQSSPRSTSPTSCAISNIGSTAPKKNFRATSRYWS